MLQVYGYGASCANQIVPSMRDMMECGFVAITNSLDTCPLIDLLRTAALLFLESIMPRRNILTDRQRAVLLDLPTDQTALLRHYTLADDDLEIIRARRRSHNRFGFALQLCALRYPGRLLAPGEVIPEAVTRFLAAQLGLSPYDLADYATREETRREHLAALREVLRLQDVHGPRVARSEGLAGRCGRNGPVERGSGAVLRGAMPDNPDHPARGHGHRTALRGCSCRG
jgi:hypothetical protein